MKSVTRWRLCCGVLSALLAYSWLGGSSSDSSKESHRTTGGHVSLHVDAKAAGINLEELVAKMLAAKTVEELQDLAKTFGTVGNDKSIDAVESLVADTRPGVPAVIVGAFGQIGTDHAVEVLKEHAHDSRIEVRTAVIEALGTTHNVKAEPLVIDAARDPDPTIASSGIYALGELGTTGAISVLEDIAAAGGEQTSNPAIQAIAKIDSPEAHEAISRLIDSPSIDVSRHALSSVTVVDNELLAKINAIVKSGETGLLDVALDALSHAGAKAVPTLIEVAKLGTPTTRVAAISALGRIDTAESMQALRDLLEDDDISVVRSVIAALSTMTGDEARDLIISSALSDRDDVARSAIAALLEMTGPEVEQALVEIAKAHPRDHDDILLHLVKVNNKEGIALVQGLAQSTDTDERMIAIKIFASAGTSDALVLALQLVRTEHADGKVRALQLLAAAQPGEPAVTELLRDTLRTGQPDEAVAALGVLGRAGSEDAREAIIAALSSSNSDIAGAAVNALQNFRTTPESATALANVAEQHPELGAQVMRQLFTVSSPVAIRIAERLLRSSDRGDSESALRALETAGTPEAGELLVRTARTADPDLKVSALRSLANCGDKRATEVTIAALHDQNQQVREQAVYSLASLRGDKSRDALIEFSKGNDANDRRNALIAMRDYGDPRTQQRIIDMAKDSDANVRNYAIDYMPDTPQANSMLRSMLTDKSLEYYQRYRIANALRYRGNLDDNTLRLIQEIDAQYQYDY